MSALSALRILKCWACGTATKHRWAAKYREWQCTRCDCTNPPYDDPPRGER